MTNRNPSQALPENMQSERASQTQSAHGFLPNAFTRKGVKLEHLLSADLIARLKEVSAAKGQPVDELVASAVVNFLHPHTTPDDRFEYIVKWTALLKQTTFDAFTKLENELFAADALFDLLEDRLSRSMEQTASPSKSSGTFDAGVHLLTLKQRESLRSAFQSAHEAWTEEHELAKFTIYATAETEGSALL